MFYNNIKPNAIEYNSSQKRQKVTFTGDGQ